MKRIILSVIVLLATISFANAQDVFSKGNGALNIGIGLPGTISSSGYKTVVPPVSVSFDYCVASGLINGDNGSIGVGAYLGYAASKFSWAYSNVMGNAADLNVHNMIAGARGSFHYQFIPKLDTYAGLMLGYNIVTTKWSQNVDNLGAVPATSASGFAWTGFIGARYMFSETFGIFAEAGYGITSISGGLTLRL